MFKDLHVVVTLSQPHLPMHIFKNSENWAKFCGLKYCTHTSGYWIFTIAKGSAVFITVRASDPAYHQAPKVGGLYECFWFLSVSTASLFSTTLALSLISCEVTPACAAFDFGGSVFLHFYDIFQWLSIDLLRKQCIFQLTQQSNDSKLVHFMGLVQYITNVIALLMFGRPRPP